MGVLWWCSGTSHGLLDCPGGDLGILLGVRRGVQQTPQDAFMKKTIVLKIFIFTLFVCFEREQEGA